MNITLPLIDKLIKLRNGESLPASALRGDWVEQLLSEGILVNSSHGSRRTIAASVPHQFERMLVNIDERLGNLDTMKDLFSNGGLRAAQASTTGNSKLYQTRSCPGFPVNAYEPISCRLNDREIVVNPPEGSFVFIADWQRFDIPNNVVIVGIENMENFRMIRSQHTLFSSLLPTKKILFVSRYPQSTDLRMWLESIPNQYVHFGDFDLAGINIFLSEFHKYLGTKSSFLIPYDIEERLQNGSAERYNAQYRKYRNVTSEIPSLQQLIDMINRIHRCYDQEGYIRF